MKNQFLRHFTKASWVHSLARAKIFGVGASILEKIILKNLYSKLGLKYEDKKSYTFGDYVKEVKEAARKSQKADLNISKVRQSVH